MLNNNNNRRKEKRIKRSKVFVVDNCLICFEENKIVFI